MFKLANMLDYDIVTDGWTNRQKQMDKLNDNKIENDDMIQTSQLALAIDIKMKFPSSFIFCNMLSTDTFFS